MSTKNLRKSFFDDSVTNSRWHEATMSRIKSGNRSGVKRFLKELVNSYEFDSNIVFTTDKYGNIREFYQDENLLDRRHTYAKTRPFSKNLSIGLLNKWLYSNIGRPWAEVQSSLTKKVDIRGDGNWLLYQTLKEILERDKNNFEKYNPKFVVGVYIDEEGILRGNKPKKFVLGAGIGNLRELDKKWFEYLSKYVGDRKIKQVGSKTFWMIPIYPKSPNVTSGSEAPKPYPIAYRQGNKFSKEDKITWNRIPKCIRPLMERRFRVSVPLSSVESSKLPTTVKSIKNNSNFTWLYDPKPATASVA